MSFVRNLCHSRARIVQAMCVSVLLIAVIILVRNNVISRRTNEDTTYPFEVDETNKESTNKYAEDISAKTLSPPLYDYVAFPCTDKLPPFPEEVRAERGVCVRTINASYHADSVTPKECVSLKTADGPTPICIHDSVNDRAVSKSVRTNGGWEYNLVDTLCKKLLSSPRMEFLDLGCNIGVYSLSVARAGRTAVCVDPLIRNMQLLSKSLSLGNLRDKVTLIWNAVSNDYSELGFNLVKGSVGATSVKAVNRSISNPKTAYYHEHVNAIRLDDLTPIFKGKQLGIKMDVERHELNVLKGGPTFFDQVDVHFIQMEHHRNLPTSPLIVEFLENLDFLPYKDIHGLLKLDPNQIKQWPGDVYFIKRS